MEETRDLWVAWSDGLKGAWEPREIERSYFDPRPERKSIGDIEAERVVFHQTLGEIHRALTEPVVVVERLLEPEVTIRGVCGGLCRFPRSFSPLDRRDDRVPGLLGDRLDLAQLLLGERHVDPVGRDRDRVRPDAVEAEGPRLHGRHQDRVRGVLDLGDDVLGDVAVEGDEATIEVAIPMAGIPDAIKQLLARRLVDPVNEAGAELRVRFVLMDEETRERFFRMEEENWSGLGSEEGGDSTPDSPPDSPL